MPDLKILPGVRRRVRHQIADEVSRSSERQIHVQATFGFEEHTEGAVFKLHSYSNCTPGAVVSQKFANKVAEHQQKCTRANGEGIVHRSFASLKDDRP